MIKLIRLLNKPEAAFTIILSGTIAQSFHTFYIMNMISQFDNPALRIISAVILGIFFSAARGRIVIHPE